MKTIDRGPLVLNGQNNVNRRKYPHLFRAVQRGLDHGPWKRWEDAMKAGQTREARRIWCENLGIERTVMSEETKAKLKALTESPEYKERQRLRKMVQKAAKKATGKKRG